MDYLVMIGQLILSLSILVVLHELGHFIPARLFGTRVEKFYLFFDPWFSLFKFKRGDTEYGIGWLPLGGYVKISGMIDESMDLEQMKEEPKEWEFRSKKPWQRLIIMLGGVTVNFLLGFLIWGMVLWNWGESYLPAQNAPHGMYADSLGMQLGLQNGDHLLEVGGVPFEKFNDRLVVREIVINEAKDLKVDRNGQTVMLPIPPNYGTELATYKNKNKSLFEPQIPFIVQAFGKDSPAKKAGVKSKDKVIALNGNPTPFFRDFEKEIRKHKSKPVTVTVERNGATQDINLTTTENGLIGVFLYQVDSLQHFTSGFKLETQKYAFGPALKEGTIRSYDFLADQIKAFGHMFTGKLKASESLGGFGTITSLFPTTWNWRMFWKITAVLSLILGFMNLLPIPALDGGHVMFLLYEVITGRKPSDKFLEYSTIAGFVVVLGLVVFANGMDVIRWWRGF